VNGSEVPCEWSSVPGEGRWYHTWERGVVLVKWMRSTICGLRGRRVWYRGLGVVSTGCGTRGLGVAPGDWVWYMKMGCGTWDGCSTWGLSVPWIRVWYLGWGLGTLDGCVVPWQGVR
jgi:hypothetical protein